MPVSMPVSFADSRKADWVVEARDIWDCTQDAILASKKRMRVSADAHRRPAPTIAPDDLVWLSARNIRLQVESTKIPPRYLGPFKVLDQDNPLVYLLALPQRLGITDSFHVSLLKLVHMSQFSESSAGTSGSFNDSYEVNAIMGCMVVCGQKANLVDWKGHGPEDRSWEPVENIWAPQLIAAFKHMQEEEEGYSNAEECENKEDNEDEVLDPSWHEHRGTQNVFPSDEEQRPGPSEVEHVSENTSSTAAETGQEQRSHSRVARRQRVPERDGHLIKNDLLISLVLERVPLWDTRDPLHSNNVTIRRLWNEVAKAMWDGWDNAPTQVRNAFVAKVKTRWCSMKDRFNKDLRQESRVPSGSGARIRKYKYHRVLAFLRPVLAQRTTWSTTIGPGSGAVLHQTATDPSQPSSSAAASGPATQTGDQEAGPSGLPLSHSSATAPYFWAPPSSKYLYH
ncbi:uncharacterized protein [Ranitomeya imitator]|uniref:uncharacterized protein n=1 Tax=Ranitomeya imitator TaxID=111125 RepID=UPI0037E7792C